MSILGQIQGPVLRPTDADYDAERSGFQTAVRHRPDVIVTALDAEDVRLAVEYATAHDLPVAVQSTGHGLSVPADGGVLISTRRLTEVRIDPGARTAWVAAGTRWGQVISEAAEHGLAPLSGSSPEVGVVGYTLGGGIGLLSRQYGFTADHVHRIEIVTADAKIRQVTADSDAELFWALRGGGGNFGVVTGLEITLIPLTHVYGGGLYFDADLVPAALDAWRRWTSTVPEEVTSSVAVIPYPDLPMVPEPLRGKYVAHIRLAFTGDVETGEKLVAPLRAVGPRLMDTLGELPFTESGSICADPPNPHSYYGDNVLLDSLDTAPIPALTGPDAPVMCVVQLNHLGGALARPPAVPNAVGGREAQYLLRVLSGAEPEQVDAVRAVHQRLYDAVAPQTVGRSPNFDFTYGERPRTEHVRAAYDADDYRRLAEIKANHDPQNTFRLNQNIPPAQ